ncbi:MAG: UDP-N-acetylmuramoyl-L-alanyl-D-glutamate--2,6-diaminopimelate ligase [Holosporaceae bacterium]|jgi:UDP-N-acetylmuramoyl-L-alanyl-D-glutamate--2,6-diaminopimelate ligase|nr:UDP-N-acetylmuramoyl-L-alanyl-D-glutamate--2,6-diaminopimelate ligase [Holosporaceae bacterium]
MKKIHEFFVYKNLSNDDVTDLCDNSKTVVPGSMFIALNRDAEQRKNHIAEAVVRGAKYILLEGDENCLKMENGVAFFFVKNVRKELARIAAKFFASSFANVVAVTGTNGKSSTVDILRQIWIGSAIESASIGTLGVITKNNCEKLPHHMTCPDCLELHRILCKLCERKIKNIAVEASSQGLDQHRLDEINFDVCAFTNFTQDHLDYHKTLENYWNAKARLFAALAREQSVFVVNADDPYSKAIREIAKSRNIKCVDYGYGAHDVQILEVEQEESQQRISASFFGKRVSFVLPLQGAFQIHNAMCAAAIAYFTRIDVEKIVENLQRLRPINGRLELIVKFNDSNIYVDYAHTPDALQNAIFSLRSHHKKNRIITVFGCGGNRDQGKRILMGKVAEKFSDVVIVTDDNPRNEDPALIRKMILEGCPNAIEVENRKLAIEYAIKMLSEGDTLLVAGKGHETYQMTGDELQELDDKKIILDGVQV